MDQVDHDTLMRMAAFEHVRRLSQVHEPLSANELKPGLISGGERIPLINPQRGIFKPQQIRYLLSIKTVCPVSPMTEARPALGARSTLLGVLGETPGDRVDCGAQWAGGVAVIGMGE